MTRAFPQPLTEEDRRAQFDRLVALCSERAPDHATALDMALEMFRVWLRAENARRRPVPEFRVIYRRAGWTQVHTRLYQRSHAALAFMEKLRNGRQGDAPVVELRLQHRLVESCWTTDIDEELAP